MTDKNMKLLQALKNIAALEEMIKVMHMSEVFNPTLIAGAAARNAIRIAKEAVKEFEKCSN